MMYKFQNFYYKFISRWSTNGKFMINLKHPMQKDEFGTNFATDFVLQRLHWHTVQIFTFTDFQDHGHSSSFKISRNFDEMPKNLNSTNLKSLFNFLLIKFLLHLTTSLGFRLFQFRI